MEFGRLFCWALSPLFPYVHPMTPAFKKILSKKNLWKESLWVLLGQFLFVLGGLVSTKVTLTYISPEPYGAYSLALSLAMLLQMTAYAGIPEAAGRFYSAAVEKSDFLSLFQTCAQATKKRLAITIPIGLMISAMLQVLHYTEWASLALGATVMASNWAINELFSQIHLAARDRKAHAIQQGIRTWLNVLFLVAMVPLFGTGSGVAMWSVVIAAVTVTVIQFFLFKKRILSRATSSPNPSEKSWQQQVADYATPHIFWGLPLWLQMSAGRWSLEFFQSTEDVGRYSAVLNIGNASIAILIQILIQLLSPYVFKRIGDASEKDRIRHAWRLNKQMIWAGAALVLTLTLIAAVFAQPIMWLLSDPKYYSVTSYLPWAVLAGGLSGLSQVLSIGILSGNNTKLLLKPRIFLGIGGTLVTALLTYQFGMTGTFIAITVYGAAQNLSTWIVVKKHLNHQLATPE